MSERAERTYTSAEVSDIVRARLAKERGGLAPAVVRDMLCSLVDRVEQLEELCARLERSVRELESR